MMFKVCAWVLLAACLGAAGVGSAHAQTTLAPSKAVECMTPALAERGAPVYPEESLKRKDGGQIEVELAFFASDKAPQVRVLTPQRWAALIASVEEHVAKLRMPCFQAGTEPVRIVQSYDFVPNDGRKVMAAEARDLASAKQQEKLRCMMRIVAGETPSYPVSAIRRETQANLLVRLRFTSPTQPPELSFINDQRYGDLSQAVEEFVAGYRMPCLETEPISVTQTYFFRLDGADRTNLKDMSLRTFLANADSVPRPAYFDLNQLSCPFDLRVTYFRPHLPNTVGELERVVPERRAFLDWLSKIKLHLSDKNERAVLGDAFTLSVPCVVIDL